MLEPHAMCTGLKPCASSSKSTCIAASGVDLPDGSRKTNTGCNFAQDTYLTGRMGLRRRENTD